MKYNANIWGPHYWFVLHTIASIYPDHPTNTMKKKYYDFIQNLPLFIPNEDMGNRLISLLDAYPVSSYLDSKQSFMKWMNFIHNKVNSTNISYQEGQQSYAKHYIPPKQVKKRSYTIWIAILCIAFLTFYIICNN